MSILGEEAYVLSKKYIEKKLKSYKKAHFVGGFQQSDWDYTLKISKTIIETDSIGLSEQPILYEVHRINKINSMPSIVGWLYRKGNEIFYASGSPDNIKKIFDWDASLAYNNAGPESYSPHITDDGDIIFIYRGFDVPGSSPNPNARQNPIIYPAGNYNNPVVVDLPVKPTAGFGDTGTINIPGIGFIHCEYTRPVHSEAHIWKVTKPYTEPSNWRIVKTEQVNSDWKHWHCVIYDPWSGDIFAGSGDYNTAPALYRSTDNGETWDIFVGGSQKYYRMLNMIITEYGAYWCTDTPATSEHDFCEICRDDDGHLDLKNIFVRFSGFPHHQATYANVYIDNPRGILILNRCDGGGETVGPLPVYFWSFETQSMHMLANLYSVDDTPRLIGFRGEGYQRAQSMSDPRILFSFGTHPNYLNILGNTLDNQVETLALEVIRNRHDVVCTLNTVYNPLLHGKLSYNVTYNGAKQLTAKYIIDGEPFEESAKVGVNNVSIEFDNRLSIQVSDADGVKSNIINYVDLGGSWERGTIDNATGKNTSSTNRLRTADYIDLGDKAQQLYILMDFTNYKISYRMYDDLYNYLGGTSSWLTKGTNFNSLLPGTRYVRFVLAYINDSTIVPEDIEELEIKIQYTNLSD